MQTNIIPIQKYNHPLSLSFLASKKGCAKFSLSFSSLSLFFTPFSSILVLILPLRTFLIFSGKFGNIYITIGWIIDTQIIQ